MIFDEPGIEQVQADISRSALYYRSNETSALIANPSNSAQLEVTPYHSAKLHPGRTCSNVGMQRGTDRHTDTYTDGRGHYTFRLGYASRKM